MKYVCFLFPLAFALMLSLTVNARAQGAPYSDPRGNVGSWSWDRPQPRNSEQSDEREPGETSWEKMQAEQTSVEKEPPRQEVLKSLSPRSWWRWWRGEKTTDAAHPVAEDITSGATEEETLNDSQEPTAKEE